MIDYTLTTVQHLRKIVGGILIRLSVTLETLHLKKLPENGVALTKKEDKKIVYY